MNQENIKRVHLTQTEDPRGNIFDHREGNIFDIEVAILEEGEL